MSDALEMPIEVREEATADLKSKFPDASEEEIEKALEEAPGHPSIPLVKQQEFAGETDKEMRSQCWALAASIRDAALAAAGGNLIAVAAIWAAYGAACAGCNQAYPN